MGRVWHRTSKINILVPTYIPLGQPPRSIKLRLHIIISAQRGELRSKWFPDPFILASADIKVRYQLPNVYFHFPIMYSYVTGFNEAFQW